MWWLRGAGEESEESHASRSKTDVKHLGEQSMHTFRLQSLGRRGMRRGEGNIYHKDASKFERVLC
jgi:hypothetical protein